MDKTEIITILSILTVIIGTAGWLIYNIERVDKYLGELNCDNFGEYYTKCLTLSSKESCRRTIQVKYEKCMEDLEFEKILNKVR